MSHCLEPSTLFPNTLVRYSSARTAIHRTTKEDIESKRQVAEKMIPPFGMNTDMADVLDLFLPPLIAEKEGQYWYCSVSRVPASSTDILHLQEQLDKELTRQEAREMGLCPIRRALYDQLLEELVRQELLSCPERGRLLRMVQLECKLSICTAISGYESALAYGLRKYVIAQKSDLTAKVADLLVEVAALEDEGRMLQPRVVQHQLDTQIAESRQQEEYNNEENQLTAENERILKDMTSLIDITLETEEVM